MSRKLLIIFISLALLLIVGVMIQSRFAKRPEVKQDPIAVETADNIPLTTVQLFYYNQQIDTDESGNVKADPESLLPVVRQIPDGPELIQKTIEELLKGNLTEEEKANGFRTEFPGKGFELKSAVLDEAGVLFLEFADPEGFSIGGSARVSILASQIKTTAMQFPNVKKVVFKPEDSMFQP